MTRDEQRALAFVAALLLLSGAVRIVALPDPVSLPDGGTGLEAHLAATAAAVDEADRRDAPLAPGERIDPNTATAIELDRLPGVGPAVADRIVADREASGRFRTTGDLTRVAGIGARTVERLSPHLRLPDGPPTPVRAGRRDGDRPGREPRPGSPGSSGSPGSTTSARGLDLNRASAAELQALPGVGPVLAARIVAFRDSAGPFPAVDSLLAVPGIGPATLGRIREALADGRPDQGRGRAGPSSDGNR